MCVKHCRCSFVFLTAANRTEIEISGGEVSSSLRCFRYEGLVQRTVDCKRIGVVETVLFPELEESTNSRFMSAGQLICFRGRMIRCSRCSLL